MLSLCVTVITNEGGRDKCALLKENLKNGNWKHTSMRCYQQYAWSEPWDTTVNFLSKIITNVLAYVDALGQLLKPWSYIGVLEFQRTVKPAWRCHSCTSSPPLSRQGYLMLPWFHWDAQPSRIDICLQSLPITFCWVTFLIASKLYLLLHNMPHTHFNLPVPILPTLYMYIRSGSPREQRRRVSFSSFTNI